ncbi:phosphoribosyltransferase [Deinococcus humi]|uniref:Putative phosphoribosyltransferase n=1 Tax=Deinococcus humi TaxID=662880 RepID=A0A7W8JYM6_9DEIO|nr:phosphoribosyltransferase [Deinococcus humi]MBB5364166.1 putative phosphoribosyltransferase [Deinococcus humi]
MFQDRRDAGRQLVGQLGHYRNQPDVVVLALPRGGVPVAYEVAEALHAPLDVLIVRKIGMPGHEEFAIGAIASGGTRVMNTQVVEGYRVPEAAIEAIAEKEKRELERRERSYRNGRPPLALQGKTVLLVDDGLATGASMRAAVQAIRQFEPAKIVVAVPLASPDTCEEFRTGVDEVVCAVTPVPFYAVGQGYVDFSQTTDEEVHRLLRRAVGQKGAGT